MITSSLPEPRALWLHSHRHIACFELCHRPRICGQLCFFCLGEASWLLKLPRLVDCWLHSPAALAIECVDCDGDGLPGAGNSVDIMISASKPVAFGKVDSFEFDMDSDLCLLPIPNRSLAPENKPTPNRLPLLCRPLRPAGSLLTAADISLSHSAPPPTVSSCEPVCKSDDRRAMAPSRLLSVCDPKNPVPGSLLPRNDEPPGPR